MSKGEETRLRLILAAIELFYRHGIHWVSFQQVASAVGITQAALYKHFDDKDDLLQACALHAVQSGREIIDRNLNESGAAEKQLRNYILGNFAWLRERPKEGVIVLSLYYFGFNSPIIRELLLAINRQSVERLTHRLEQGIQEKKWRAKDPRHTARLIHDLLLGEMIKTIHAPNEYTIEQREKNLWSAIRPMIQQKKI